MKQCHSESARGRKRAMIAVCLYGCVWFFDAIDTDDYSANFEEFCGANETVAVRVGEKRNTTQFMMITAAHIHFVYRY